MTVPALRVAVLVPCFNEEAAVPPGLRFASAADGRDFVYDIITETARRGGRAAGAIVRSERRQGKGPCGACSPSR